MKKVSIMSITVRILIVFFVLNHGIMASAQISSSYSSNTQWHKLGSVYANDGMQKYVVQVGTANAYETLKLTVQDVPTEIIEIIVIYNDGERSKIAVRSVIHANESREFNLIKQRSISSIEIKYNAVSRNGKTASLSVWGI